MAAGDFLIRSNTSNSTNVLPNAGSNIELGWDTEVIDEGSAATFDNIKTFTLTNSAPYLIMYSERWTTTNTTNNERVEGQGRIRINGSNVVEGASEGYIRKSSGQQDMIMNGVAIYNATAGDTLITHFYRGDNSTTGSVTRVAGYGGVQIIELAALDKYARYSTSGTNTISSTVSDITNWTNNQQDTGFARTSGDVVVSDAGRYLMTFSGTTTNPGSARLGATVFAEIGGVEGTGVRGYSHMRGSDGNQNGALSFAAVINCTTNQTITLRRDADNGSMTLDAGAVWQFWKLPSSNQSVIMEATTGNMNPSAATNFAWDTLPYINTTGFTATAGNANIDVNQNSHVLVFWNHGKKIIDSVQRGYPMGRVIVDTTIVPYIASGAYHRNSGAIGTFMTMSGAGLVPNIATGSSIAIQTESTAATGNMDVESGHFSIINLEGLYKSYTYTLPLSITDVDTDEVVTNSQTNVVITGSGFGSTQGTGKVELVEFVGYTGTKITQSVSSWADGSITCDINTSLGLSNTNCFLFVTTNGSADQGYIPVQVGLPPETYAEAVIGMTASPDHYWKFQNSYADEIGTATANNTSGGTPTFDATTTIVKGDTHTLLLNNTADYISPADQSDMNTANISRRYIGGWFMLDRISQTLSVLYEEGAQVNNMALLNGFGNNAMFQIANAADDYIQLYLDVSLTPNRPYHFIAKFHASGFDSGICEGYLDGILQSRTDGNPWETAQLDSHSGNITWGHEGTESLKVGDDRGVDATTIAFVSPVNCNYAHWYSWSNVTLNAATDIRKTLFEKGAVAQSVISSDTEVNMQTDMDLLASTLFPDWPCSIEVETSTSGNFSLTMDNITFDDRVSIQVRYLGIDTITLVATGTTVLDTDKLSAPYGGTIVVENPATFTIDGLITGSEVRIYDNNGGAGLGVELSGIESLVGTTHQYSHNGALNDVVVQVIATGYEESITSFQLLGFDQTLTVILTQDKNA